MRGKRQAVPTRHGRVIMSYTDGRDFFPEYTRELTDGTLVEIEKVGGGTVGRSYDGNWRYRVTYADGDQTFSWDRGDLHTGTPKTHAEALVILCEFLWPLEAAELVPEHADYPHLPGTLYDCPACEASGELDAD